MAIHFLGCQLPGCFDIQVLAGIPDPCKPEER